MSTHDTIIDFRIDWTYVLYSMNNTNLNIIDFFDFI